jgi:N-acetylmuramoyl-L-alanine amidase
LTLSIADHVLTCDSRPSPNFGGAIDGPLAICMHFTAGRGYEQSLRTLRNGNAPKGKRVSAHLLIGRGGECAQLVRFNRVAWHAGDSSWRGRKSCNKWMLGIELDNAGKLSWRAKDKRWVTWFGVPIEPEALFHADDGTVWHRYSEQQLAKLDAVVQALLLAYPSIAEIVGHSDVKATKSDPGPAFPWARYRAMLAAGERVA